MLKIYIKQHFSVEHFDFGATFVGATSGVMTVVTPQVPLALTLSKTLSSKLLIHLTIFEIS